MYGQSVSSCTSLRLDVFMGEMFLSPLSTDDDTNVVTKEVLVTHHKIGSYIDHMLKKRLAPKTINCHLISIRRFYDFLRLEEDFDIANPVRKGCHLRQPRPLPKHLKDDEVKRLLAVVDCLRDRAIIMLMLRSGLRVGEVVNLTLTAFDWSRRRLYIHNGKGG